MYVSEKIRHCLQQLHSLHSLAMLDVPDNLPMPERFSAHPERFAKYSRKFDSVIHPCYESFRYALVAFLSLNNLLAIANQKDIYQTLLGLTWDDFDKWLDRIEEEGSVT